MVAPPCKAAAPVTRLHYHRVKLLAFLVSFLSRRCTAMALPSAISPEYLRSGGNGQNYCCMENNSGHCNMLCRQQYIEDFHWQSTLWWKWHILCVGSQLLCTISAGWGIYTGWGSWSRRMERRRLGCVSSWQHIRSFQDSYRLVTMDTHDEFLVLHHWEARPPAPWPDIPFSHTLLTLESTSPSIILIMRSACLRQRLLLCVCGTIALH